MFSESIFLLERILYLSGLSQYGKEKENWDPKTALLEDRRMKAEWRRLCAKRRKPHVYIERKTPRIFLADIMRSSYYMGQVQACAGHDVPPGEAPHEKTPSVAILNTHWCRFLKVHIDSQLKKPLSHAKVNLLRYQLQDIAHQRLFVLSDILFPKMYRRYDEAGYLAMSGTESVEYQLIVKGSTLTLQCNKIFRIYKQATMLPIGYDTLSIDIAIDLNTFIGEIDF